MQEELREFKRLSVEELKRILEERKENLRQLRFDLAAGKVKDIKIIRKTKKSIARIMTIITIRQLANKS